jgi:hypothetical protein
MPYPPGHKPWLGVAARKRTAAERLEARAAELRREADEAESRHRDDNEAVAS